jgi:hypothetical protein
MAGALRATPRRRWVTWVRMRTVLLLMMVSSVTAAQAGPLVARVERMEVEPTLVVAPVAAGKTAEERYRAWPGRVRVRAGVPAVLLIRLPVANSPDVVKVIAAERHGQRIRVKLETRRYTGPLSANVVAVPLVEVELGALAVGRYQVGVDETVLDFDRYDAPQVARNPRRGMGATLSFPVD